MASTITLILTEILLSWIPTSSCLQLGFSLGQRPPFKLESGSSSSFNQHNSYNPSSHSQYATHAHHSPHGSVLHPCISPRYQILSNFYGDYFKPGLTCFAGYSSRPFIDVRGDGSSSSTQNDEHQMDFEQEHLSFSNGNIVLKSFVTSGNEDNCDGGECNNKVCDKQPEVCHILKKMKEQQSKEGPYSASSSSFVDSMRQSLDDLYSYFNRRSFTSSSSSTLAPTFPLFSLFSTPTFSSDNPELKPIIFRPSSSHQLTSNQRPLDEQNNQNCVNGRCPPSISPPASPFLSNDQALELNRPNNVFHNQVFNEGSSTNNRPLYRYPQNSPVGPPAQGWSGYGTPIGHGVRPSAGHSIHPPSSTLSNDHFSLGPSYSGVSSSPLGYSSCQEVEGVAYPLMGISASTGHPIVIKQHYPDMTQPVFFRKCLSPQTHLSSTKCQQQFLPISFIVSDDSSHTAGYSYKTRRRMDELPKDKETKEKTSELPKRTPRLFSGYQSLLNPFGLGNYNNYPKPQSPLSSLSQIFSNPTEFKKDFVFVESGCRVIFDAPPYSNRKSQDDEFPKSENPK